MPRPLRKTTKPQTKAIRAACEMVGSTTKMAQALGIHDSQVSQWATEARGVPAHYCWKIEALTQGRITCEQLRPDVFVSRAYGNAPAGAGQGND